MKHSLFLKGGSEETNLHLHRLHNKIYGNGDNNHRFVKGSDNMLVYGIDLPANQHMGGTHWYHSHIHGKTWEQVEGGAFRMIIIDNNRHPVRTEDANVLKFLFLMLLCFVAVFVTCLVSEKRRGRVKWLGIEKNKEINMNEKTGQMSRRVQQIFVRRHNLGCNLNVINILLAIYDVKFHGSVTVNSAVNSFPGSVTLKFHLEIMLVWIFS